MCEITYDIYRIFPAFSKFDNWKVINPNYEATGKGLLPPQDKTIASLEKTSWFLSFRQCIRRFPDLLTENPSSRLILLRSRWTSIAFRLNRYLLLKSLARNLVFCSSCRPCFHKNTPTGAFANPTSTAELQLLPLITENNAKRRKRWCDDHKTWASDDWKNVIWSPTSGRDYVRRTPK